MKTLIAYASKSGTARKCALALAQKIDDATLVDLQKEKPNPAPYEQVIIGGGVRMGALHLDARQYLDGCKELLLQRRLGVFLCAGFDEKAEALFENNVDPELRAHALQCVNFGGEVDPKRLRGLERLIVRMVMRPGGASAALPRVFPERIEAFAKLFAQQ